MKKRNYGIDIIKVWAMVSVIGVHHLRTIGFYETSFNSGKGMYVLSAIHIVFLACVPLFLLTTGYLLSNRKIDKSHYKKALYFLIEVLVIYIIGYFVYRMGVNKVGFQETLKGLISRIMYPDYYVSLYLSLYFIAPFINKMYKALSEQEKKYLIAVLIFVISLPKLQSLIPGLKFYNDWPTKSYPLLYYIIGVYLQDQQFKINKKIAIVFILLMSFLYAILLNVFLKQGHFSYIFGYYEGIFTVVISTLIFLILYDVQLKNIVIQKAVKFLSATTMAFYLLSENFTDEIAMRFITLNEVISKNIWTIFPKIVFSIAIALPAVCLIFLTTKWINSIIKNAVN